MLDDWLGCLPHTCPRRRLEAANWRRTSSPASPGDWSASVKNRRDARGQQPGTRFYACRCTASGVGSMSAHQRKSHLRRAFRAELAEAECGPKRDDKHTARSRNGLTATRQRIVAERKGFEPLEPVKVQRFSRPPLSTAQPPLRAADLF